MSNGQSLEELTSFFIEDCGSFVSFPNGGLIAPKLSEFHISKCPKLRWLPEKMTSLSALKHFNITDCPLIEPFPGGEGGLPVSLVASPYLKEFLKENESSVVSERLFKLKSMLNCLAAVRFEVENKKIKNPAVEKWLDDLLDAIDDAEDFFGDIEYDAMKPNNVDESKKARGKASKLLSRFSKPFNSADHKRNTNIRKILKRLEYLANQIGNLNLEKNVDEAKPSEGSRVKTSLPDEPELYETWSGTYFVMHDLIVDLARTISGKYSCLLEQNDNIDRLEKKARHLGCVMELYTDNKIASHDFGATRLRTFLLSSRYSGIRCLPTTLTPLYHYPPLQSLRLENCGSSFKAFHLDLFPNLKYLEIVNSHYFKAILVSDGQSLEELTYLGIRNCGSFVSFPNGGLIAPKLSEFEIINCPKLKWLPEKMTSFSALERLEMRNCPLIETFPEGGLP
ncbi:hypothetical protein G4B88_008239, partial [Cannabis sativa]